MKEPDTLQQILITLEQILSVEKERLALERELVDSATATVSESSGHSCST